MRQKCIDLLFANTFLFLTREQFEQTLEGWELEPMLSSDGFIGLVFLSKDAEFHFQKFSKDIQCTREILNKYPSEIIKKHGYATTKTPHDDKRQQRFNERLGFYRVGEDDSFIHYRIDQLRKKEIQCQQSQ